MKKRTYDDMIDAMKTDLYEYKQKIKDIKGVLDLYMSILKQLQSSEKIEFSKNEKYTREFSKLGEVERWMQDYVSNHEIYNHIVINYEKEVFKPLNSLNTEFENIIASVEDGVEGANMRLDIAEESYANLYKEYIDKCHAIEAEPDHTKAEKMKIECAELEQRCLDYTMLLAKSRRNYCFEIEVLFISYEKLVDKYYKVMQTLLEKLPSTNSLFTKHFQGVKLNENMLKGSIIDLEAADRKNLQSIQFVSPSVELDFDIFKFVDPSIVYEPILSATVYEVKQKYCDESNVFCLNPGDYVNYISKKGKIYTVEIVGSGLRGEISPDILEKCKFKRYILKINEEWDEYSITIPAGTPLCVCKESDDIKICLTPSLTYLHVPNNYFST